MVKVHQLVPGRCLKFKLVTTRDPHTGVVFWAPSGALEWRPVWVMCTVIAVEPGRSRRHSRKTSSYVAGAVVVMWHASFGRATIDDTLVISLRDPAWEPAW